MFLEQMSLNDSEMELSPFHVHHLGLLAARPEKDRETTRFINMLFFCVIEFWVR